jgi:hypothetical protein
MPDEINKNLHRQDRAFPHEKPVQEDFVPLGVERVVEGRQSGVNSIHFGGLVRWVREHAVQSTVGGFVIGYLVGSLGRRDSVEAL